MCLLSEHRAGGEFWAHLSDTSVSTQVLATSEDQAPRASWCALVTQDGTHTHAFLGCGISSEVLSLVLTMSMPCKALTEVEAGALQAAQQRSPEPSPEALVSVQVWVWGKPPTAVGLSFLIYQTEGRKPTRAFVCPPCPEF